MFWLDNFSVQRSWKKPSVNCCFLPRASGRFPQIICTFPHCLLNSIDEQWSWWWPTGKNQHCIWETGDFINNNKISSKTVYCTVISTFQMFSPLIFNCNNTACVCRNIFSDMPVESVIFPCLVQWSLKKPNIICCFPCLGLETGIRW